MNESQYDEVLILQSIFSEPGEFLFEDETDQFLFEERQITNEISFYIATENIKFHFQFPEKYPDEGEVKYRIVYLPKILQNLANIQKIIDHIKLKVTEKLIEDEWSGDPMCLNVIEYVKELVEDGEFEDLTENSETSVKTSEKPKQVQNLDQPKDDFLRYFIYAHHIYSQTKRKNMIALGSEFDLTGFTKAGKPGVVVVEGTADNVKEFWRKVRSWNWQHIEVRHQESLSSINAFRFDKPYKELTTTDLSDLNVIFMEKGCGDVFERLFGVRGSLGKANQEIISSLPKTRSRLWIWTHHVYCGSRKDSKRKDVVDYGVKLGLAGFSLPGKPGFIAVEGDTEVCYDYWKNLKSWGWKRIELRHEEKDFSGDLCFEGKMQELHFLNPTSSRNNCIDYGRFREFLVERGLGSVFEVLFKGEFKEKVDGDNEHVEI